MIASDYLEGVWYDVDYDAFVTLKWDDTDDTVLVCDEAGALLDSIDEVDFDPVDYYRIPDQAVDDPVDFLERYIHKLTIGECGGNYNQTTYREEVAVQYAADHVDIVERDD